MRGGKTELKAGSCCAGSSLSWILSNGVIELALHREPCNELGSVSLGEFEKFAAALESMQAEAHALIIYSCLLYTSLVEEEREEFGYKARLLDWWDYWINVHIPALRKWTYPLIEGRPLEVRPARNLQDGETVKTGTDGAQW